MGKVIQISAGFSQVYMAATDRRYSDGDQLTLTDAEYAGLPTSTSRALFVVTSGVADPIRIPVGQPQSDAEALAQAKSYSDTWFARTINPMAFGAVGDGVADDTIAVQAALNAIADGTVVLFTKPHKITAGLTVTSKSRFGIEGGGLLSFAATTTSVNGAITALQLTSCNDFRVTGIKLDIVTQNQQYNGISIASSSNGKIERCKVTNSRWVGAGVYDATPGTTTNITFDKNTIEGCRYGISVNGKWMRVTNNHVAAYWLSTAEAASAWTSASVYWDAIIIGAGTSESTFSGNTIIEPGQSGIYASTISACTIADNVILRPQNKGIDIGPPTNPASSLTVSGNTVVDAATGGIHFFKVNDSVITGNTCMNTGALYFGAVISTSGIILNSGSSRNSVVGNTVQQSSATSAGVFVNNSAPSCINNLISSNTITASTKYSITQSVNTLIDSSTIATNAAIGAHMVSGNWYSSPGASITTLQPAEATVRAIPLFIGASGTINALSSSITVVGTAGAVLRMGVYADDGSGSYPGTLMADAGTVAADASTGIVTISGLSIPVTAGTLIWLASVVQGAAATRPTLRVMGLNYSQYFLGDTSASAVIDTALSSAQINTTVTGALPSSATWFHAQNGYRVAAKAA